MIDHLRRWFDVRESVPWHEIRTVDPSGAVVPVRDGPVWDVEHYDHARDPVRAAHLLTALDLLRADAAAEVELSFDLLGSWQRAVLGTSTAPRFREVAALAKAGRERYGIDSDIAARFTACLAEAVGPGLSVAARGARVYLDVCFFHPFADGNARSAFLALTFVLARAGITLDQVGPIRRIARRADSPTDAFALAKLVAMLIETSARRSVAR